MYLILIEEPFVLPGDLSNFKTDVLGTALVDCNIFILPLTAVPPSYIKGWSTDTI